MDAWTERRAGRYLVRILAVTLVIALLPGCATPRQVIRQGEGPTAVEIFEGSYRGGDDIDAGEKNSGLHAARERAAGSRTGGVVGHAGYVRDSVNEIRQLFPVLPNPTIALYVDPHHAEDPQTGEFLPVPGYTTAFALYPRVEYALPGEMPASRLPTTTPFPAGISPDSGTGLADTDRPAADTAGTR